MHSDSSSLKPKHSTLLLIRFLLEGLAAQNLDCDDDSINALSILNSKKPKTHSVSRYLVVLKVYLCSKAVSH